ncbi:hypothetical protein ES703_61391 [subsurface metagenome]
MKLEEEQSLSRRFKWHIIIICAVLAVVVLLTVFTDIFRGPQTTTSPVFVWKLGGLIVLITLVAMLAAVFGLFNAIRESNKKLGKIAADIEKSREVLLQINQSSRLSETAKAIASRDADHQSLREAVFDRLQQKDFATASEIIDEIAHSTGYQELANQLRAEADKYRDATDTERVNQVIANIEKLFESFQWAKASAQIEKLIAVSPESEKAKAMRQKLLDKKQERKKVILNAWDDAVKRQATDRSLDILKELDMYLTPNEGLALQEAARDVFRNKLHNLGVQFSLAVSSKQWDKALKTGEQIMRDFPNSRMSEEIREKWDILKQIVQQQGD